MSVALNLRNQSQNSIRVVFSNRGLSEVITSPVDISSDSPDINTLFGLASFFSDLTISNSPPFGFNSVKELVGIDYVGYIIDKERLDPSTGNWVRIDEYKFVGSQTAEFKDSRVAYGYIYRYRIRSVVKLTLPIINPSYQNLNLQQDIRDMESQTIANRIKLLGNLLNNINNVTNMGVAPKTSQGQKSTVLNIVNGLQVVANSQRILTNLVTSKSQKSVVNSARINQNSNFDNTSLPTGNISNNDLQRQLNDVLQNFISKVIQYKSFYYTSENSKKWIYVPAVRYIPPDPPSSIAIIPNSVSKQITITWLPPPSLQRDVKYVRVYKKNNINNPWRMISQNQEVLIDPTGILNQNFVNNANISNSINIFVDNNVLDTNNKAIPCIYALTSVDVHGIESVLSTQIQAQINDRFVVELVEKPLKWISGSGALPKEIGVIYKKFINLPPEIIAHNNITISPDVAMKETINNLLVRVTSLDTHEVKELKLTLNNLNISTK